MEFRRFSEPRRLGKKLLAAHLPLMLLLSGCMESASTMVLPTASPKPYYSGTRSFFAGDLVTENNNLPVIVECLPRNGKSFIDRIDYSRGVVVLHNTAEMPLNGPSKSLATVVGDMETDIGVLANIQSENGGTMFLIDSKEFEEGVSAKSFRTGIFEANLSIDPYLDDASVEKDLPDKLVEVCHK